MADLFGAANSLLGGASGLFSGLAQAKGSKKAAAYLGEAARITARSTAIKVLAQGRDLYRTLGAGRADIAASGLELSGSAADVMRASAQEGAISRALIQEQGKIDEISYLAQQEQLLAAAKSQKGGGIFKAIAGVAKAAIFLSEDRLKIIHGLVKWDDEQGFGIYRFNYLGGTQIYEGVLVSEIENVFPDAITVTEEGIHMVDYDMIGVSLRLVGHA